MAATFWVYQHERALSAKKERTPWKGGRTLSSKKSRGSPRARAKRGKRRFPSERISWLRTRKVRRKSAGRSFARDASAATNSQVGQNSDSETIQLASIELLVRPHVFSVLSVRVEDGVEVRWVGRVLARDIESFVTEGDEVERK